MPTIRVDGPPIADIETRRTLIRKLTDAVHDATGVEKEHITVVLRENRPENIGTGGELLADVIARRRGES